MDITLAPDQIVLSDGWASRSEKWRADSQKIPKRRKIRERQTAPLILCGHGISMRVENGTLVVREGFTHYPQEAVRHQFFPGDLTLPMRILLLDGSGTLSFDVMNWLIEQGATLLRITWDGRFSALVGGPSSVLMLERVRLQERLRGDQHERVRFSAAIITEKLRASIHTLKACFPRDRIATAVRDAEAGITALQGLASDRMQDIRAIEGSCAWSYFLLWRGIEMKWTSEKRHPIPNSWKTFWSRSSLLTGNAPENYHASHPINAMLNYAYAVQVSLLHEQLLANGFDPKLGIMHQERDYYSAFAYDLIEIERPRVDLIVLDFVARQKFAAPDFILRKDGVCRLAPQLAKTVAVAVAEACRISTLGSIEWLLKNYGSASKGTRIKHSKFDLK
jgi:CRISPR-associated protein Cas1